MKKKKENPRKREIIAMLKMASNHLESSLRGDGEPLSQTDIDEIHAVVKSINDQIEPATRRAGSGG